MIPRTLRWRLLLPSLGLGLVLALASWFNRIEDLHRESEREQREQAALFAVPVAVLVETLTATTNDQAQLVQRMSAVAWPEEIQAILLGRSGTSGLLSLYRSPAAGTAGTHWESTVAGLLPTAGGTAGGGGMAGDGGTVGSDGTEIHRADAQGLLLAARPVRLMDGLGRVVLVLDHGHHHAFLDRDSWGSLGFLVVLLSLLGGSLFVLTERLILRRIRQLVAMIPGADPAGAGQGDELAVLGGHLRAAFAEQERQAQALRDREARLAMVLDAAVDAIVVIDERGLVELWNVAAERMFGWTANEIIGQSISRIMPVESDGRQDDILRRFRTESARRIIGATHELVAKHRDGRLFPMELSVSEMQTVDGRRRFTGFVRDISARKEGEAMLAAATADAAAMNHQLQLAIESAYQANQAKSDFLASMSHEIRTPMNGVIGMANLLADTSLTPEQREYVQAIRLSGDALLTLINDILDFSKIEAGKMTVEPVPFDLRSACDDVLDLLAAKAVEKDLALVVDWDPRTPMKVQGDQGRIRQILINLVGNALKFTAQGGVLLRIRLAGECDGVPLIRLEVHDTGIGMTAEQQAKLFQPFSQADASTTRRFGGTGLGLAICKRLAELMSGSIGVDSRPGTGSVFHLTLPLPRSEGVESSLGVSVLLDGRALVVSDCPFGPDLLARQLTGCGLSASAVAGPGEAIERLIVPGVTVPDLVVIDLRGRLGEALGARLLAEPALARCRIVLLVNVALRGDAKRLAESGFAAYLAKPIRMSILRRALAQVLAGRSQVAPPFITRHSLTPSESRRSDTSTHLKPVAKRWRVLLAEDNQINQRVATKLLEKQGCTVDLAGNGLEAVEQANRHPYDLILMDCQMPELDGFQATERLRARPGPCQQTPIVALTANAMQGDRERCLDAGMSDYLTKPLAAEALHKALERWLPVDEEDAAVGLGAAGPVLRPAPTAGAGTSGLAFTPAPSPASAPAPARRRSDDDTDMALTALTDELGDRSVVREIIRQFLEDAPALLHQVATCDDCHTAEKLLHQLKGMARTMRLPVLGDAVAALETETRAGRLPDLSVLHQSLQQTMDDLRQRIEE